MKLIRTCLVSVVIVYLFVANVGVVVGDILGNGFPAIDIACVIGNESISCKNDKSNSKQYLVGINYDAKVHKIVSTFLGTGTVMVPYGKQNISAWDPRGYFQAAGEYYCYQSKGGEIVNDRVEATRVPCNSIFKFWTH